MTTAVNRQEFAGNRKRVLFISYYFPPSGGPGVQRTLKFVRYLFDYGWDPVVLTVEPTHASYPALDRALENEAPPELEVIRTKAWDPYSWYARLQGKSKQETVGVGFIGESAETSMQRLGKWIRGNVFVPDARMGWIPFAARAGRRLLRTHGIQAIVTTGPPHSTHVIGKRLARDSGIPWIADFRDPWTGIDFYDSLKMTRLAKKRDARLELSVLKGASRVVAVTPGMVRSLSALSGRPVDLIMNGYDPADFDVSAEDFATDFTLSYVGNMNATRNPEILWRVLQRLSQDGRVPTAFRVRLVGPIDGKVVESIRFFGLEQIVSVEPAVSHADAVRIMVSSQALLLVINRVPGSEGIMTGKLFEYIGSGRPVLGIGPPGGDAANAIRLAEAGELVDWDDADGVEAFLGRVFDAVEQHRPFDGAAPEARQQYSRPGQAARLATILDEVVSGKTTSS